MSWKFLSDRGRQIWKYFHNEEIFINIEYDQTNPNSSDKIYRNFVEKTKLKRFENFNENYSNDEILTDENKTDLLEKVIDQTKNGLNYYINLQDNDGHWPGDYGGPLFLLAGAIITSYVTQFQFQPEEINQMIRYLFNHQLNDGGWGTHIESHSTMFGTVLNYISLRILGISSNENRMKKALKFIHDHGGPQYVPSWAKFWLCVLNLMPWSGINSILPELWLLPEWLPFHPSKYWCHCRMVYLSMSYVYSEKISSPINSFIENLRNELYDGKYCSMNFIEHRNSISSLDLYQSQTWILKFLNQFLNFYERIYNQSLRNRASKYLFEMIEAEDKHTNYIDIGPVNKFINMISINHRRGRNSQEFLMHLDRVQDYLWLSEDGMKIQGYNGSQLWDTVFSIQAILETGFHSIYQSNLSLAYHYLEITQVLDDVENYEKYFRHQSKGGWPFSTRDHGWPITDCTAEGLKCTLLLNEINLNFKDIIDDQRLEWSIDFLLSCQNKDGGWASYELQRGSTLLEWLNPSEIFHSIMIDYSYVECTSACLQALNKYSLLKKYRFNEIQKSIKRGQKFIENQQRTDGSWFGSWAICFTYGTWFAVEGLIQTGQSNQSLTIKRAIEFLLSKQNSDGGWGESFRSSIEKIYIHHQHSQIVNTSWAILTLLVAQADRTAIEKGIRFLLNKQLSNGDWTQQSINGIFNGTCTISYTNYRNIFPLWALGRFIRYSKY